uniref:Uncharacterized protein n=1 Tax=Solanum lycopersicum TaxID=4081 RepID=A0A3Q7EFG4_SOLLC
MISHFSFIHWSSLTCVKNKIVKLYKHVTPLEEHPEILSKGFTETRVSTIVVKDKLLFVGGLQGELII